MVFEPDKIETLLIDCIESKNDHQFQYLLDELNVDPNKKLRCFDGLSTFEKVLTQPHSRRFIQRCFEKGCDFYKKNSNGIYPLHYAINSFCADNLETILKPTEKSFTSLCDDHFVATQFSAIINEKLEGGNNYLHLLINNISEENYKDIFKMINAMIVNGCNINYPNDQYQTPFYLLLKNQLVELNLIKLCIDMVRIDYYSYNSDELKKMMIERGLQSHMSKKFELIVDMSFITQHLGEWNEVEFISKLDILNKNSQEFLNDIMILLEEAVVRNLPETVAILMSYGVKTNEIPKNSKFKMTPLFLACTFGHHQVVKVLLNDQNLSFQSYFHRSLLHQTLFSDSSDTYDLQKCFDMIIADKRCTMEIINQLDDENRSPILLACQRGYDEITKELLRRGAYIGYESVLSYMNKDVLEDFLDECVKCSTDVNCKDNEIYIDYKFLMPPEGSQLEITTAHLISANSTLKDFILHPVIESFVLLKWRKINFIVYFNLLVYFSFMLFLGISIVNFYNVPNSITYDEEYCTTLAKYHDHLFFVNNSKFVPVELSLSNDTRQYYDGLYAFFDFLAHSSDYSSSFVKWKEFLTQEEWKNRFRQNIAASSKTYWFAIFGLAFLAAYEIVQFAMSWKNYFFKPINWLDISLISFSLFVFVKNVDIGRDSFQQVCAIMILLMGAQSIQLCSKISAFSLSLHMAILNKVCSTFLKTIAPYLIIISAFGMSFYALNFELANATESTDTYVEKGFSNPFLSTISTVRMMLSDFGAINIKKEDHFKGTLFLAFMIAISIILFNLLNALAISDTNEMKLSAEFVETKKRISTLRSYEKLYSFCNIRFSNVFPKISTIMLTPNRNSLIKVKQRIHTPENVIILMQKTGKTSKYEYLYSDWMLWKREPKPVTFDEDFIKKILDYVKNRQEIKLNALEKNLNNQELHALRVAQEDIYKELQYLKISQRKLVN